MSKEEKFKEKYIHVWNQYQLRYNSTEKTDQRFQLLAAITGILILIFFELKLLELHILFSIPLLLFSLVIVIGIYHVVPRKFWVPWIEKDDLTKRKWEKIVDDIYGVVKHIEAYSNRKETEMMVSINLILFGTFISLLTWTILKTDLIYSILSVIIFGIILLFFNLTRGKEYL